MDWHIVQWKYIAILCTIFFVKMSNSQHISLGSISFFCIHLIILPWVFDSVKFLRFYRISFILFATFQTIFRLFSHFSSFARSGWINVKNDGEKNCCYVLSQASHRWVDSWLLNTQPQYCFIYRQKITGCIKWDSSRMKYWRWKASCKDKDECR